MAVDALPARVEARQRALVGGLDLLAQRGQRGAPQPPQHLGVAPLALGAARAQLAAHELARRAPAPRAPASKSSAVAGPQLATTRTGRACAPSGGRGAPARPARRPRNAAGRPPGGTAPSASRYRPASSAAIQRASPAEPDRDRAAVGLQLVDEVAASSASSSSAVVRSPTRRSTSCSASADSARVRSDSRCRSASTVLQRVRVDQVAQLLLAEQLAQQVAVQRQRGGAALGVGRVALVHVRRDVVEQQRRGERRRGRRLDLDHASARASAAWSAAPSGPAGRARRAGTRGRSRARSGTARSAWRPRAASATSAAAATAACAGRGRRAGSAARGRRSRGSGRRTARDPPSSPTTRSSSRSGSISTSSAPGGSSASGRWTMIPSSDQIASDSRPYSSRIRALSARPQAACTRPP